VLGAAGCWRVLCKRHDKIIDELIKELTRQYSNRDEAVPALIYAGAALHKAATAEDRKLGTAQCRRALVILGVAPPSWGVSEHVEGPQPAAPEQKGTAESGPPSAV
jgi:hypothetical protein